MTVPSEAAIEAAAKALYEAGRDPDYTGPEWDWENIDRSYDWDGDTDEPHGAEWLRDRYRADARTVLAAVLPVLRADIANEIADALERGLQCECSSEQECVTFDGVATTARRIARSFAAPEQDNT